MLTNKGWRMYQRNCAHSNKLSVKALIQGLSLQKNFNTIIENFRNYNNFFEL